MDADSSIRVAVLANKLLIGIASTVAGQWEKFTGWLVAGLGASLALIIANVDKTKDMLPAASVSFAVKLFVAILIVHTIQKILSTLVASAAESDKEVISKADPPLNREESMVVLNHIQTSYFFPFSLMVRGTIERVKDGDIVHVGRRVIRFALVSALLAGVQLVLAVCAVWAIARGLV